ncbi:MAG: hydrogenase subunit MbhD domain-containing protein [Candidatus Acetothermia bacterium]
MLTFFLLLLLALSISVVLQRRLLNAVILLGVFSLTSSTIYFLAGAPDVAVTEGAIGVAFVTFIYVLALSDQGKLHVITEEIPPFFFQERGEIKGIDHEILLKLAEKLNLDLEVEFLSHPETAVRFSGRRGKVLAGAYFSRYCETIDPLTSTTYHRAQLARISAESPSKRTGTISGLNVTGLEEISGDRIRYFDSLNELIEAYNQEKVDSIIADSARLRYALNRINAMRKSSSEITQIGEVEYSFAISREEPDLLDKVNDHLNELESNGQLKEILSRYLR